MGVRRRAGTIGDEQLSSYDVKSHCGLLYMSGRPLLYSPAFCRFDMDLMSSGQEVGFMYGGYTQRRKSDGAFF